MLGKLAAMSQATTLGVRPMWSENIEETLNGTD